VALAEGCPGALDGLRLVCRFLASHGRDNGGLVAARAEPDAGLRVDDSGHGPGLGLPLRLDGHAAELGGDLVPQFAPGAPEVRGEVVVSGDGTVQRGQVGLGSLQKVEGGHRRVDFPTA
jgi:hypothetical protein